jgi:gas vesicle protein
MKDDEGSVEPTVAVEDLETEHGRAGFVSGFMFGLFIGAGFALLFAPERGDRTRGRLRRRIRALRQDALEGIDRAGSRTRAELQRRKRRLRAELKRIRKRAQDRARAREEE